MAEKNTEKTGGGLFVQIFSGLGIGLLVGVILGMSVSPVVSIILGALASLLAALLGLQDGAAGEGGLRSLRINGIRIGSFGFACVAGILFGLFIRAHELLSVPVEQQVAKWTAAGYTTDQARQFVAYQKLGIKPESKEIIAGELQKAHSSSLFSGLASIDLCSEISMERFGNDPEKVLRAYRRQDNAKLSALADELELVPEAQKHDLLLAIEGVLCDQQRAFTSK